MLWDARPAPPVSPDRVSSPPSPFARRNGARSYWVQCGNETLHAGSSLASAPAQQTAFRTERTGMARRPQASRGSERSRRARLTTAPFAAIHSRSQLRSDHDGLCPTGRPTYPTPNATKFVSRSRQNRGCNQSSARPVTELLTCDGFATPGKSPEKTGLIGRYLTARDGQMRARAGRPGDEPATNHTAGLLTCLD